MPRGIGRNSGTAKPSLDLEAMDSKQLSGRAKPGTKIEARNVSRSGRDSFVETGADGHFRIPVNSKKGDTLELHIQTPGESSASSFFVRNDGRDAWTRVTPPDMDVTMLDELEFIPPTREHMSANGEPTVGTAHLEGPLFIHGVSVEDVQQGAINNCYFACGLSLLAHYRPEAIQNAIQQLPDGNFQVTLLEGKYRPRPVEVIVNSDLFVTDDGTPIYTHSPSGELWPMILEKAYAQHMGGSYEAIGQGGKAGDVVRAFTGEPYMMHQMQDARSPQEVFETIRESVEAGRPASAGTYGDKGRYEGMKLYANHNYAVLGGGLDENSGEPYLLLRNPWGQSEPDYNGAPDGKDDGIFRINMEDFTTYFMTYSVITESNRRGG